MTEEHFIWPYIMDRCIYHDLGRHFAELPPNTLFPWYLEPFMVVIASHMMFRRVHNQGMARHAREDVIVSANVL